MILSAEQWIALLPILLTAATSILVMLGISVKRDHWGNATLSVAGLNLALFACAVLYFGPVLYPEFIPQYLPQTVTPLLVVDHYAVFYMGLLLSATLATATLSHAYLEGYKQNQEEYYLLLVLAALGGLTLACSRHMASFFIGLELLSVPLFGMIAYTAGVKRPLEGAIKYLVLSAAASAFLLFGMALIYLQTGTLAFDTLAARLSDIRNLSPYVMVGSAMILVGVGFKLSVVPFHLWTPDVYEGAPAPVTAYLSTASKTAVFVVLLRYFNEGAGFSREALVNALTVLAIASILIGNILALLQTNLKRLLAYSSIAQFGYLLVVLVAPGPLAVEAAAVFLLTYVITNLGAFGVVTLVSSPLGERDADSMDDYKGLFWRRPLLVSILTAMMLSLAGIPITAGFIGKFYVIAAGVDARLWLLLGAVLLGSAIALYYYLRVIIIMFQQDAERLSFDAPINWAQQAGGYMVLALMLLMLIIGMYPEPFIKLAALAQLAPR